MPLQVGFVKGIVASAGLVVAGGDMALCAGIHPSYETPLAREFGTEQTCDDMREVYLVT